MAHILEGKTVEIWCTSDYVLPFSIARIIEVKDGMVRFEVLKWKDGANDNDMTLRENFSRHWYHFDRIYSFHEIKPGTEIHDIAGYDRPYRVA